MPFESVNKRAHSLLSEWNLYILVENFFFWMKFIYTFLMLELNFYHSLPREIRRSVCSYFSPLLRTMTRFCAWNKCCRRHLNRSSSQHSRQLGQCLPGIKKKKKKKEKKRNDFGTKNHSDNVTFLHHCSRRNRSLLQIALMTEDSF